MPTSCKSKSKTSMSFSCSELGFLFLPYSEMIGSCVFSSMLLLIRAPSSAVPLKPCSGVNMVFMLMFLLISVSMRCVLLKMLVWLAITPTRLSFRIGKYNSSLEAPTIASSASTIFFYGIKL